MSDWEKEEECQRTAVGEGTRLGGGELRGKEGKREEEISDGEKEARRETGRRNEEDRKWAEGKEN